MGIVWNQFLVSSVLVCLDVLTKVASQIWGPLFARGLPWPGDTGGPSSGSARDSKGQGSSKIVAVSFAPCVVMDSRQEICNEYPAQTMLCQSQAFPIDKRPEKAKTPDFARFFLAFLFSKKPEFQIWLHKSQIGNPDLRLEFSPGKEITKQWTITKQ